MSKLVQAHPITRVGVVGAVVAGVVLVVALIVIVFGTTRQASTNKAGQFDPTAPNGGVSATSAPSASPTPSTSSYVTPPAPPIEVLRSEYAKLGNDPSKLVAYYVSCLDKAIATRRVADLQACYYGKIDDVDAEMLTAGKLAHVKLWGAENMSSNYWSIPTIQVQALGDFSTDPNAWLTLGFTYVDGQWLVATS